MRVLLINAVTLNGGDAAIMLAIREQLRRAFGADVELVVADGQAAVAAELYPDIEFIVPIASVAPRGPRVRGLGRIVRTLDAARWRLAARARRRIGWLTRRLLRSAEQRRLAAYADVDLVVSTGGTYLVENYDLRPRSFELGLVLALGRPLVLHTQSLGPFRRPANRRAFRRILSGARAVMLRDERSLANATELGVAGDRLRVLADVVFTFAQPAPPPEPGAGEPLRIAISVREWAHFARADGAQRYVEAIRRLCAQLVRERGAEVTFLSTCQGVPAYWTDDSAHAVEIVTGLPADVRERVAVDRGFHRPEALLERLAGFDAIVSTRMHVAILGLCVGTPVLPIAYEFKTRELFARLGLEHWVRDIDELAGTDLGTLFDAFWADRDGWRAPLAVGVERERALADEAVDVLRHAI